MSGPPPPIRASGPPPPLKLTVSSSPGSLTDASSVGASSAGSGRSGSIGDCSPRPTHDLFSGHADERATFNPPTCHPLSGGKTIDHYFPCSRHVAAGAFGTVDKRRVSDAGWDLIQRSGLTRPEFVAVKQMQPASGVPLEETIKETVGEVSILRQVGAKGLNVIPQYFGCLVGNTVYVVMEWIEGSDLIDLMARYGETGEYDEKMPGLLKSVICQGAIAIHKLHEAGIVHGDIRAENIRIQARTGRLYLIDLGASCFSKESPRCDSPLRRQPDYLYLSPALYLKRKAGTATFDDWMLGDWWAFSLVLYFIFEGNHPYSTLEYYATRGTEDSEGRNYLKIFFGGEDVKAKGREPYPLNELLFEKLVGAKPGDIDGDLPKEEREKQERFRKLINAIAQFLMFPPAKKDLRKLVPFCTK